MNGWSLIFITTSMGCPISLEPMLSTSVLCAREPNYTKHHVENLSQLSQKLVGRVSRSTLVSSYSGLPDARINPSGLPSATPQSKKSATSAYAVVSVSKLLAERKARLCLNQGLPRLNRLYLLANRLLSPQISQHHRSKRVLLSPPQLVRTNTSWTSSWRTRDRLHLPTNGTMENRTISRCDGETRAAPGNLCRDYSKTYLG